MLIVKFKSSTFLWIIYNCFILINHGNSQIWDTSDTNDNKNTNGQDKFQCRNGQIIASDLLCDGKAECADQSDETQSECSRAGTVCPHFAFRCKYGACVSGSAKCNGVQDCIDNSDETLPECRNPSANECSQDQFKCDDGQCIEGTDVCDGIANCRDQSDETNFTCGSFNCDQVFFRCNYGACINRNLICNGRRDCVDNSDEDVALCGGSWSSQNPIRTTTTRRPPSFPTDRYTTTTTRRPWTTAPPTTTPPSWKPRRPCLVPPQPQNGRWRLHRLQCNTGAEEDCDINQGVRLDPGTNIIYSCNAGYKLNGSSDVFCGPAGEWSRIPKCVEIRCKPLSSASLDANCRYNNKYVSCDSPVLPQTTASLDCRTSYHRDKTLLSTQTQVRCNNKGQWEPEPIRCIPDCGKIPIPTTPLIVNGTRPNITEFPWHATLYMAETPNSAKEFICGATIIQDNLLVTAAHCIYDETNRRAYDPDQFYVATGNNFRDYDSNLHNPVIVRKAKVKRIYRICNYKGLTGNYASDIAILEITEPFVFSPLLIPACLDTNAYSDRYVLEAGNYGKVAGFGKTAEGSSSAILQSINLPYVPFHECSASAGLGNDKFITDDKFCAGYRNGSSVCDGDSGGGLVFETNGLWYLRGIVSVGVGETISGGSRTCDSYAYSLYTRISRHIEWIQSVILKVETNRPQPTCEN